MDCSSAVSSVRGISQARILEWVAISSSRGSFWPRNQTCICCIGRWILYHWTNQGSPYNTLITGLVEGHVSFFIKTEEEKPGWALGYAKLSPLGSTRLSNSAPAPGLDPLCGSCPMDMHSWGGPLANPIQVPWDHVTPLSTDPSPCLSKLWPNPSMLQWCLLWTPWGFPLVPNLWSLHSTKCAW